MALNTSKIEPLVSIITLNYNQNEVTCSFLESARNLTYKHLEILVCDMHSNNDPTDQIMALNIPNVSVHVSAENLGYAGGNNWGIKKCSGSFILVINNDTIVTGNLIEQLLDPFHKDPNIGVVCPKIKYYYESNMIQYAGFMKMNMYTGRVGTIGDKSEDNGQYDHSQYTNGAHGCAMMIKRDIIQKTGMFPEKFFLYYEEWDWSFRILRAGYKIYYQSAAIVYHKESMSVGKNSLLKTYYLNRNRILLMRRNCNTFQLCVFSLYTIFISIPKNSIQYLIRGKIHHLSTYWNAVLWNVKNPSSSDI